MPIHIEERERLVFYCKGKKMRQMTNSAVFLRVKAILLEDKFFLVLKD